MRATELELTYVTVVGNTAAMGANGDANKPVSFGSVVANGQGGANCDLNLSTQSSGYNPCDAGLRQAACRAFRREAAPCRRAVAPVARASTCVRKRLEDLGLVRAVEPLRSRGRGSGCSAADRIRWRREDRLRWMAVRREVYGGFLTALDQWNELDHAAAVRGEVEQWFDAPPEDRLDALLGTTTSARIRPRATSAAREAHARLAELELVGSAAVTECARELSAVTQRLSDIRYSSPPRACGGASDDLVAGGERYQAQRQAFVAAVRRELGAE